MASSYPGGLDNFSTTHADNVDEIIHASTVNDNADAINKIEAELGTDPKGSAADVKTRIANTETVANAAIPKSTVTTKGDLIAATGSAAVARLAAGTDGQALKSDSTQTAGVKWANSWPTRQIFTVSGTYTLPAGCKAILVECIGAGGGGGGTPATAGSGNGQAAAGAGGGGGAYAASLIASPSASYSVTVGTGGAGGVGGNNGSAGGNTSFGTTVVAEAGQGGVKGLVDIGTFPDTSSAATRGGLAANCTGDVKLEGGSGWGGLLFAAFMPAGGTGGAAARGGGDRIGGVGSTLSGNAGRQYGGGGAGAAAATSATAQNGGAGGNGICIVTEYY